jgi:hypothetical protein
MNRMLYRGMAELVRRFSKGCGEMPAAPHNAIPLATAGDGGTITRQRREHDEAKPRMRRPKKGNAIEK